MRKTVLAFLITFFTTLSAFSQSTGYGYVKRDIANNQVNYAEIAKNATDRIKRAVNARERAARDLGWSSAAEMDAARRKHMTKLRNERKMRALQYRINKKKKKAELRRIKKENRLKRKKPKS
jgi:hypothetical protein